MNLSGFDLNLLRVLDALLHEGSTVRAGLRIGMSQPAVSHALGRLREALGDDLFIRQGQKLVPTDFARQLAAPLREELDRLQALLSGSTAFDPQNASFTFRLAGSDFFAEMLMPKLGACLSEVAPGVRVQLVDLLPDSYVGTIERYHADLALIPSGSLPEWIEAKPMFRSSFVVIARKAHPALAGLEAGCEMPIDAFCSIDHVVFSPEGNFSVMGDTALRAIGRTRRVVMTLPVFSGVCRVVSESNLIAIIPRQLADKVVSTMGLNMYRPPVPLPSPVIIGIWHRRSSADLAHKWMRQQVRTILAALDDA